LKCRTTNGDARILPRNAIELNYEVLDLLSERKRLTDNEKEIVKNRYITNERISTALSLKGAKYII